MSALFGLIGLPNIGKSSIFNIITKNSNYSKIGNYPFCTIEPSSAHVNLIDKRLAAISKIMNSKKTVYRTMQFIDIAGLVKGASNGEGLGNKFLSHVQKADALCHVVRAFSNTDVSHIYGKIDPLHDIDLINTELILHDLEVIDNYLYSINRKLLNNASIDKTRRAFLLSIKNHLESGKLIRLYKYNNVDERLWIKELNLLSSKPTIYILNFDINTNQAELDTLAEKIRILDSAHIIYMNGINTDNEDFLNKFSIICDNLLKLQSFFTTSSKETRAWGIKINCDAQNAAKAIHSDISDKFIIAEVISYENFIKYKTLSKKRLEGKSYLMKDGDIVTFKFNR
jgi:GTP-binding protein YchF